MRTDSVKSLGLTGSGILPADLGIHSTVAFVQAVNLAERNFKLFRAHGDDATESMRATATSDVAALRAIYQDDPSANFHAVCGKESGLYILNCPRPCDLEWLERDLGPLPKTWTVGRDSGETQHWFRGETGPEYKMRVCLHATHATLRESGPVPGSINARTGQRYYWRPGLAPGLTDLAVFPLRWQLGLPKASGLRITDSPVHRPEFRPDGKLPAKWK